jgi:hypothetical protein
MVCRAACLVVLGALGLAVGADGADYFTITYNIDRSGPRQIRLDGRIFNNTSLDAVNVRLRVQALSATGVVAELPAFVDRLIRARHEGYWDASVPPDPRITGFRVVVTGYRFLVQGP